MSLYVTKLLIEILVSHKKLGVCFFFVSDTGDAIDTKILKKVSNTMEKSLVHRCTKMHV